MESDDNEKKKTQEKSWGTSSILGRNLKCSFVGLVAGVLVLMFVLGK